MIINIDELVEKEEKNGFQLRGKEYIIPDIPYILAIELSQKGKVIRKAVESGDVAVIMEATMEVVMKVLPEFTREFIEEQKITVKEMLHVSRAVNETERDEEDETELEYYRKQYKDEFRKKEKEKEKNENTANGKT